MEKKQKLILIGDSAFAEIAYEYFTYDSEYEVVAFAVEKEFITKDQLFGIPVVPFESIEETYDPADHYFFAANVYTQKNKLRTRLYLATKEKGYLPASYISPRAFVWRNVEIGEHCFIFEDNVIQPFVKIGNNVILWSGNHIGHHSIIKDHNFISSHVVISGFCEIGESGFIGVNASFADRVTVGNRCIFGAGALVLGNVPDDKIVVGMWKKQKKNKSSS